MTTPPLTGPFEEEDFELFREAFKKALFTNQESFQFQEACYMTKFAKELIMNNTIRHEPNERCPDRNSK